jgi:hypothetical protein
MWSGEGSSCVPSFHCGQVASGKNAVGVLTAFRPLLFVTALTVFLLPVQLSVLGVLPGCSTSEENLCPIDSNRCPNEHDINLRIPEATNPT